MNTLRHFALGEALPDSPHAVCACLPKMRDVCGYEEGERRVLDALRCGYPRFMVHPLVRDLTDLHLGGLGRSDRGGVLLPGRRTVAGLLSFGRAQVETIEVEEGVFLVHWDQSDGASEGFIRKFIQHTGCGLSSRRAEDLLSGRGRLPALFPEPSFQGNAGLEVERELARLYGCRREDVLVCASGMNAFYAAFRAVQELQASRGRRRWIQLGWLYLDSGRILQEFLGPDESLTCVYDPGDGRAIEDALAACGDSLAGVVVEVPTNPLVQWCDLPALASRVRGQGGILMADPTMASAYNVDVLPCADVLVNSLTKYAALEGDVMIGALALNQDSAFHGELLPRVSGFHQPPYERDLARLALEMRDAPEAVAVMNRNAAAVAGFLADHPAVAVVRHAGSGIDGAVAQGLVPSPVASGAIVTVELKGAMEPFYDRLRAMKGPSFGTRFTLVSPFLYLAHYDLVTTADGRRFLKDIGLHPELLRISVGTEPLDEILEVLAEALAGGEAGPPS